MRWVHRIDLDAQLSRLIPPGGVDLVHLLDVFLLRLLLAHAFALLPGSDLLLPLNVEHSSLFVISTITFSGLLEVFVDSKLLLVSCLRSLLSNGLDVFCGAIEFCHCR
eukprot:GHVN01003365.1.p1 GENE.GHVN01003365.1~~GHVN01003365.1.p1  ORF type:complete len:108 (-),score=4.97 GHVN01003365.1:35-358(-)